MTYRLTSKTQTFTIRIDILKMQKSHTLVRRAEIIQFVNGRGGNPRSPEDEN